MTLLDEVVAGASGDVAIATLLRQVKVLAVRTGTGPLEAWVSQELAGYQEGEDLASYRGPFVSPVYGHFMGPFNVELQNVQIPRRTFAPDLDAGWIFEVRLPQPIAEHESMTSREQVEFGLSADFVQLYNHGVSRRMIQRIVREDLVLVGAKRILTRHTIVGLLDAVRTKVLDLALQLERVVPEAGQSDASDETQDLAALVINNHFHGPTNMAIGASGVTQSISLPARGNPDQLVSFLEKSGLPAAVLVELREAIEGDKQEDNRRWPRVRRWFGKVATDSSTQAIGGVIASAAIAFFS
jgi:hypothetical protein